MHFDKDTFLKPSDFENWFTQMFLVAVFRYADYVSVWSHGDVFEKMNLKAKVFPTHLYLRVQTLNRKLVMI